MTNCCTGCVNVEDAASHRFMQTDAMVSKMTRFRTLETKLFRNTRGLVRDIPGVCCHTTVIPYEEVTSAKRIPHPARPTPCVVDPDDLPLPESVGNLEDHSPSICKSLFQGRSFHVYVKDTLRGSQLSLQSAQSPSILIFSPWRLCGSGRLASFPPM